MNRSEIRDEVARVIFTLDAGLAYNRDSYFCMQWKWMESMLTIVTLVLEDEEIPEDVQRRIVKSVIYGGPDPSEAEQRIRAREAEVEALMAAPNKWVIPE